MFIIVTMQLLRFCGECLTGNDVYTLCHGVTSRHVTVSVSRHVYKSVSTHLYSVPSGRIGTHDVPVRAGTCVAQSAGLTVIYRSALRKWRRKAGAGQILNMATDETCNAYIQVRLTWLYGCRNRIEPASDGGADANRLLVRVIGRRNRSP